VLAAAKAGLEVAQLREGTLRELIASCLCRSNSVDLVQDCRRCSKRQALFQFCSSRYLTGSMLITTNLEFERWTEVFGDERLTGGLLDPLTHKCHILKMNGESYRFVMA